MGTRKAMGTPVEAIGRARVATTFLGYTPSASSEASGFPAANVSILERPRKTWRSTALGEQSIVLDFGSAKAALAVFLDNANFAAIQIQGNPTNVWTAPAFDTGALTIEQDPRLRRRKKLVELAAFNFRFMRVLIPPQTPEGGAGFYELGAAAVADTIATLLESVEYPLRWRTETPQVVNEFPSGGIEKIKLGTGKVESFFITVVVENDEAKIKQIYDLLGDTTRTILFDASLNVEYESYLGRVATNLAESWPAFNPRDFGEIEFRVTS